MGTRLVVPDLAHLPAYAEALKRGWSPDNVRSAETAREHLAEIERDPEAFVRSLDDREARGEPIPMPDGTTVARLPGYFRWIFDGDDFCGAINFRWKPGTEGLPPYCPGHIGYAVVPWLRGRGHATAALRLLLPDAAREGLRYVEITTDPDNVASRRVIEANGGVLHDEFMKPASLGGTPSVRYRIGTLTQAPVGRSD